MLTKGAGPEKVDSTLGRARMATFAQEARHKEQEGERETKSIALYVEKERRKGLLNALMKNDGQQRTIETKW